MSRCILTAQVEMEIAFTVIDGIALGTVLLVDLVAAIQTLALLRAWDIVVKGKSFAGAMKAAVLLTSEGTGLGVDLAVWSADAVDVIVATAMVGVMVDAVAVDTRSVS